MANKKRRELLAPGAGPVKPLRLNRKEFMRPEGGVVVKQPAPPEAEVPVEILATAIKDTADAARRLLDSGLTKRAVLVLIHDACKGRVSRCDIEDVLEHAAELSRLYARG